MIQTISAVIILGLILYTQWEKLRLRRGKRTVASEQVAESQLSVCACKEEAELEVKLPVEKPGK
jgi:hypothetical protein